MKDHGLLLVNLGSPAKPTTPAVKKYLREFLGDHNVVEMPAAIWKPLLNGIILPMRSWRSATFYRDCWLENGSPLIVNTANLTKKVQELLPNWVVKMAMTYGEPSIGDTLRQMKKECKQIIVLSLFPHFTQSTTQSIIDQVKAVDPTLPIIDRFADEDDYLDVLSQHIQEEWDQKDYDLLIISYHGIPVSMVKHGDPYQDETERTTKELRKRLDIPQAKIKMAYQSKFGPMPWLKPYLKNTLLQSAQLGKRNILIVAPSFVTDCLETIEENSVQNYQAFRENGGDILDVVPSLNDNIKFANFLANLAQERLDQ
ncbi:MAG: ferrochelatase [Limosilactobacillus sp.]|jgi:ferrochelatase|uniref:ferrochelatase n=1 Tax=Limosilactobacillus sp. TaxID=2773925 RepID=UPI0025BE5F22|nr:ferrochelatase [Limosilactobacillus sp.]MCI1974534.1 ferrochelatase [Limosilactobacillus sp.]MCI2030613.1 ferrochelatase [Limosilactobacillus sp.]